MEKHEAKKELDRLIEKEAEESQKTQDAQLPKVEKDALEAKRTADLKEADEKRIAAEEQAKKDAALLSKKDEEVTDEADKKRKAELLKKQQEEAEAKMTPEDKIKKIQESTQKRIDELSNQLKQVEDKHSKEAQQLRQQLEVIQKEKKDLESKISKPEEDIEAVVDREESDRQARYLQEDASKPREKRREMSQDELNDWLLEDQAAAIAFINRRETRRLQEKILNLRSKHTEKRTKELIEKQIQSWNRAHIRHPELDVAKRQDELKAQGKNAIEINDIIMAENPKYKLVMEIAGRHPEWLHEDNAPEMAIAEMEKELSKQPSSDAKDKEIEGLKSQIEELNSKIESILNPPDEGIGGGHRPSRKQTIPSEGEKAIIALMQSQKASQKDIDIAVQDYRHRIGQ